MIPRVNIISRKADITNVNRADGYRGVLSGLQHGLHFRL